MVLHSLLAAKVLACYFVYFFIAGLWERQSRIKLCWMIFEFLTTSAKGSLLRGQHQLKDRRNMNAWLKATDKDGTMIRWLVFAGRFQSRVFISRYFGWYCPLTRYVIYFAFSYLELAYRKIVEHLLRTVETKNMQQQVSTVHWIGITSNLLAYNFNKQQKDLEMIFTLPFAFNHISFLFIRFLSFNATAAIFPFTFYSYF